MRTDTATGEGALPVRAKIREITKPIEKRRRPKPSCDDDNNLQTVPK